MWSRPLEGPRRIAEASALNPLYMYTRVRKKQTYIPTCGESRTSNKKYSYPTPHLPPTQGGSDPPEASGDLSHGRRGASRPPSRVRGLALHSHARGSRPLAGLTSKIREAIRHVGRGSSAGGKIVGGLSNSPPLNRKVAPTRSRRTPQPFLLQMHALSAQRASTLFCGT